jgi:hypothetical protein
MHRRHCDSEHRLLQVVEDDALGATEQAKGMLVGLGPDPRARLPHTTTLQPW